MKYIVDVDGKKYDVDAGIQGEVIVDGQVFRVAVQKTGPLAGVLLAPAVAPSPVPSVPVEIAPSIPDGWQKLKQDRAGRLEAAASLVSGKIVSASDATKLLEAIIRPFDKVNIEGDNQKQADFLAEALSKADPGRLHDLHMVQSAIALDSHLDVFEKGIAKKIDFFCYAFQGHSLHVLQKWFGKEKFSLVPSTLTSSCSAGIFLI